LDLNKVNRLSINTIRLLF